MQPLWSQGPRSHICSSCRRSIHRSIHSNAMNPLRPVVRRSTTTSRSLGARGSRRRVGAGEIFTAFYTTIMATAALADADHKDRRRKELDDRIAEARQDLAQILRESSLADCSLALHAAGSDRPVQDGYGLAAPPRNIVEGLAAICIPPEELAWQRAGMKQREHYLSWLHSQFGLWRRWKNDRPVAHSGLDNLAAALLAEEQTLIDEMQQQQPQTETQAQTQTQTEPGRTEEPEMQPQRESKSPVQFTRMMEATNRLVDALLLEANRLGHPDDVAAQKRAMESLDSPWTAIRMLRSDGYPMYRLADQDPAATLEARCAVNAAARVIFEDWRRTKEYGPRRRPVLVLRKDWPPVDWYQKQIKFWVAKLCFNLLVSSAPPGMHNYNALAVGFTAVGEHSLAKRVIDSFLLDTHLYPTQQTLVCLLQHYRAQGDLVGFYHILRRMVALDNRGAKIRRRTIDDTLTSPFLVRWARHSDVGVIDGYIVQRAKFDGPVVDAILGGLLALGQVRHAAVVFASHLAHRSVDGALQSRTLNWLANCVLDAVDRGAARTLLRAFAENAYAVTAILMTDQRYSRKLAFKIRLLLTVATTPEPLAPPAVAASMDLVQRANDGGRYLAHALFVAETLQYLQRLRLIVAAALHAIAKDVWQFRAIAEQWVVALTVMEQRQQRLDDELQRYQQMARLKAVDDAVQTVLRAGAQVVEAFFEIVSRGLAEVSPAYEGFLQQRRIPFEVRFASYQAMAAVIKEDSHTSQGLLERHVADMTAFGAVLEADLKEILLQSLSAEDCAAAGIDMKLSIQETVRDVSLSTLLVLRAQKLADNEEDNDEEAVEPDGPKPTGHSPLDFKSRYASGLFRISRAGILTSSS